MHEIAPLIYDLAVMLSAAAIVVLLFQRIKQPVVLGYLVAGIIVGPYTPPHSIVNDIPNIKILSELGVIFLMFSLGLEFSFQKLTRVGFSASVTGLIEVVLMIIVGYAAGEVLGWPYYDCLFLGAALSISSTTIIIKAIDELGLKTRRFAELIFGVLVVEDLLAILLLVTLSTLVLTRNIFSLEMVAATIKLILVVGSWFLVGYFLMPPLFRRLTAYINQETLTILSVALCLSLVSVAAKLHYSTALGAFIMGSILAETTLINRIEHLIRPIRDIFAAVFFISVGMLIDPSIIIKHWPTVIFISLVTIVGKIFTTSIGALLTGQSLNTSVRVGFGMAQVGEFSFIIAALGLSLDATSNELYPIIVAVSGITTFTTPYLIRFSAQVVAALEKKLPEKTKHFLLSYSNWVYRTQLSSKKNSFLRSVSVRLFLNGIIVGIIFTVIHFLAFAESQFSIQESITSNTLCLLLALAVSSPFIWGMLFSFKAIHIPIYAKTRLNPAVFMIWLITLAEITILSIVYFHTWVTIVLFIAIAVIFFAVSYRHLEKSYQWFESQLIRNIKINGNDDAAARYEDLAPWDTHLVEMEVGNKSNFAGMSLSESQIRHRFCVSVVAICRGAEVIPTPRGEAKIMAHDKLIVLGNDEQIDLLKKQVERMSVEKNPINFLGGFTLIPFLLESNHPLVGKTIRDSKIREYVNGIVVGLERDNNRILNPTPETILRADDLLLILGEKEKIDTYELDKEI